MNSQLSSNARVLPSVIGHRGACGHAPENTLASILQASELGVTWVEFDVKLSADGKVIVFHDDTLERTTDGQGPLTDVSLAELSLLDAGGWFDEAFRGEPVPTLEDAITILAALGLSANIEIKPSEGREVETAEAVCRVLSEHWPESMQPPLISSFKDACLMVCCEQLNHIERALLVLELPDDWQARVEATGSSAIHVWYEPLTQDQVQAIIAAGYPVRSYTVNEQADGARLFDWGVQSIITNFPDRFL